MISILLMLTYLGAYFYALKSHKRGAWMLAFVCAATIFLLQLTGMIKGVYHGPIGYLGLICWGYLSFTCGLKLRAAKPL